MKRKELEKHLGEMMIVEIGGARTFTGCLRKCGDERFKNEPNLYLLRGLYFLSSNENALDCVSWIFCCSHVKRIKLLN